MLLNTHMNANIQLVMNYYRFSQPRDHLQWRLVLGYYD